MCRSAWFSASITLLYQTFLADDTHQFHGVNRVLTEIETTSNDACLDGSKPLVFTLPLLREQSPDIVPVALEFLRDHKALRMIECDEESEVYGITHRGSSLFNVLYHVTSPFQLYNSRSGTPLKHLSTWGLQRTLEDSGWSCTNYTKRPKTVTPFTPDPDCENIFFAKRDSCGLLRHPACTYC